MQCCKLPEGTTEAEKKVRSSAQKEEVEVKCIL